MMAEVNPPSFFVEVIEVSVEYRILERHGELSRKDYAAKCHIKEVNTIKWNDGMPVLDIRNWTVTPEGIRAGKGVTLNPAEVQELKKILSAV